MISRPRTRSANVYVSRSRKWSVSRWSSVQIQDGCKLLRSGTNSVQSSKSTYYCGDRWCTYLPLLLDLLVDSMIYSRPIAGICSARPRKFTRLALDAANWKNEIWCIDFCRGAALCSQRDRRLGHVSIGQPRTYSAERTETKFDEEITRNTETCLIERSEAAPIDIGVLHEREITVNDFVPYAQCPSKCALTLLRIWLYTTQEKS